MKKGTLLKNHRPAILTLLFVFAMAVVFMITVSSCRQQGASTAGTEVGQDNVQK
jgi:hypothetical protein